MGIVLILKKIVNHNINYGLGVIMICQCGCINCNKCTTLMRDADSEGGELAFVRAGQGVCVKSVPSS